VSLEHSPGRAGVGVSPSWTTTEFCKLEKISRSALYKMWKAGIGPRFYFNGVCRIIPEDARLEFHRQRMAAAEQQD
jgi:hypothetical protein